MRSNRLRISVVAGIVAILCLSGSVGNAAVKFVLGVGNLTCGKWTAERQEKGLYEQP